MGWISVSSNFCNKKLVIGELSLNEVERTHITQVLQKTNWIIKGPHGAAKILGMKPSTLYHRMKKLGIHTGSQEHHEHHE